MILVLVEAAEGALSTLSAEALTFARPLAVGAGVPLHAVVVGEVPDTVVAAAGAYGVDVLHVAQGQRLASYSAAAHAACAITAAQSGGALVLLAGASPRGNEILAHVAARTGQRMAANVTSVESLDPAAGTGAALVVQRQVMGGSALEELDLTGSPALLTMAGHAVEPAPADLAARPEVRTLAPELSEADLVARVRRSVPVDTGSAALTSARVVVGAGRGVGGAERFDDLLELTERLGGALGVSRVVTSLGWRPHHEQVGQTGSRITPDVYIACGISGAIQHWAGCSSAKTIIAINTDEDAPMVTKAHYAVIGDLHEIIPAVNAELAARQSR